ncbi:transposase [Streptomyces sp. ISL-100]|uniref:transposase n=1 Tax=Streptomyces sp. ISL-100 TaxID=2819173 RepID=UPI00203580E6|nr:transposase [Streptomyces sp. ISL-100]
MNARAVRPSPRRGSSTRRRCGPPRRCRPPHAVTTAGRRCRKRHIVTDTLGLLLVVAVTAANVGDRDAAVPLLVRLRRRRHQYARAPIPPQVMGNPANRRVVRAACSSAWSKVGCCQAQHSSPGLHNSGRLPGRRRGDKARGLRACAMRERMVRHGASRAG